MKNNKILIISAVVSLGIIFIVMVMVHLRNPLLKKQYDIVIFGDSNIGNYRYEIGIAGTIKSVTGKTVLNAAIGGTTLVDIKYSPYDGDTWNYYSMESIAHALNRNDLRGLLAAIPKYYVEEAGENLNYLKDVIKDLSRVDFSKVETIFVCQGLNDYLNAVSRDEFENALRTSIEALKKAAPNAQIILVSPAYNNVLGDCVTTDTGAGCLTDYIALEAEIAGATGITLVNLLDEAGINKDNASQYLYDGMHYNMDGAALVSRAMLEAMTK